MSTPELWRIFRTLNNKVSAICCEQRDNLENVLPCLEDPTALVTQAETVFNNNVTVQNITGLDTDWAFGPGYNGEVFTISSVAPSYVIMPLSLVVQNAGGAGPSLTIAPVGSNPVPPPTDTACICDFVINGGGATFTAIVIVAASGALTLRTPTPASLEAGDQAQFTVSYNL